MTPRSAELWMNKWLSGLPPCYEDVAPKPIAPPPVPQSPPEQAPIVIEEDNSEELLVPAPEKKNAGDRKAVDSRAASKRPRAPVDSRAASKRPRVPIELCVEHTEATEETLTNMSLPRSEKISSQENQFNIAEIVRLEALLGKDLDAALKDRPPRPMKHRWKDLPPEQKVLEGKLNRKGTDHYNKLQYAWNRAEVARLRSFIKD